MAQLTHNSIYLGSISMLILKRHHCEPFEKKTLIMVIIFSHTVLKTLGLSPPLSTFSLSHQEESIAMPVINSKSHYNVIGLLRNQTEGQNKI